MDLIIGRERPTSNSRMKAVRCRPKDVSETMRKLERGFSSCLSLVVI